MTKMRVCAFFMMCLLAFTTGQVDAQTTQEVDLGDGALARYRTPAGALPRVATLAIHRTADYRNHASTTQLQSRGFATLGIRTRFGNSEAAVDWELIALDIRNGIRFLKSQGIEKVILIGHSGGGPSTSYFQAVAENGPSYCQAGRRLTKCPFTGAEFLESDKADGIVFLDAHPGNPINTMRSNNASVINEADPFGAVNESLDPFEEANGFNPDGDSVYSSKFVNKYAKAQSRRMNRLIKEALRIKREIDKGKRDPSDNAFVFYRSSARLSDFSTGVHRGTQNPAVLLLNDGTTAPPQIINTVRVPDPGNREDDAGDAGVRELTITSFLSANAIRSKHSLEDIDWCSSNNSTICAVRSIAAPILVIAAQGHYFIRDGEQIFEESASQDKDFIVIEGMTHGLGNCGACATFHGTGPYTNVPANLWNHVADWITDRFPL
jgi:hypothetical protein